MNTLEPIRYGHEALYRTLNFFLIRDILQAASRQKLNRNALIEKTDINGRLFEKYVSVLLRSELVAIENRGEEGASPRYRQSYYGTTDKGHKLLAVLNSAIGIILSDAPG
jgi:predicted transcriptional regulator